MQKVGGVICDECRTMRIGRTPEEWISTIQASDDGVLQGRKDFCSWACLSAHATKGTN